MRTEFGIRVCLGLLELHMHDSFIIYDSQFTRTQLSRIAYRTDADANAVAASKSNQRVFIGNARIFGSRCFLSASFMRFMRFSAAGIHHQDAWTVDCGLTASVLCLLSDSCAVCKLNEVQIYYLLIDLSSK